MLGVFANYHDFALALYDFALFAHRLHGRSYFHLFYLLLTSPGDTSAGQIVRRHLHRDLIAGEDPDEVHSELTGDMGKDRVTLADIDHKHGVGQGLDYRALEFDYVVFCQNNFPPGRFDELSVNVLCHSEYFGLAVGYEDRVLIMRGKTSVIGHDRPVVVQNMNAVAAGRYHRLNGYRHAGNEPGVCPFALYAVVRDLGCLMHVASDAVADIVAHNAEAVRLGILLDRRADIVDAVSCSCEFQSLIKALTCDLNEFFLFIYKYSSKFTQILH